MLNWKSSLKSIYFDIFSISKILNLPIHYFSPESVSISWMFETLCEELGHLHSTTSHSTTWMFNILVDEPDDQLGTNGVLHAPLQDGQKTVPKTELLPDVCVT
jgi:hypothetical protein